EPVLVRGGVGGDRQLRTARQHVQRQPWPERGRRTGRLAGEDPRGAGLTRAASARGGRLDREQRVGCRLADLGQLLLGKGGVVRVLHFQARVVVLAGPVQPGLPFRVAVQPGEILIPPRVRGNRFRRHVPPPVQISGHVEHDSEIYVYSQ